MPRRALCARLLAALLTALVAGCGGQGHGSPVILSTRIDPRGAGVAIPPSFLGLSSDWNVVPNRTGVPATGANIVYARLMAHLAAYGGGVPTLRVGGNFQDSAWWDPTARITVADRRRGLYTPITAAVLAGLAHSARLTGQRMIVGLNLAADDPSLAATEVREILRYVPRRDILAFAIGNEPDAYRTKWRWQQTVNGRVVDYYTRPAGYNAADYLDEWARVAAAVSRVAPGVPLAGTDGYGALVSPARFLAAEPRVVMLTQHYYAASSCDQQGQRYQPGEPGYMTLARLLANQGTEPIGAVLAAVQAAARYGKPAYVDELNSTSCGGRLPLSDGFGASLWALDQFFADAIIGARGVDLHGDDYRETPFRFFYQRGRGWSAYVEPLYYAMVAFAQAAGQRGELLAAPTFGAKLGAHANAHVYAVRQPDGSLRVVVLNKSLDQSGTVRIAVPGTTATASLSRLQAPAPASINGITFAGQTFGGPGSDGRWLGARRIEQVRPSGGVYEFALPRASAATLSIPAAG